MMKPEIITIEINRVAVINNPAVINNRIAVGNDVVHLPTFLKSLTPLFIKRSYTENELAYCTRFADPALRYASTWAAKEAVYKALKQADEHIKLWWRDIEINRPKPQGKPTVSISKLKDPLDFSLTITHDGDYVWALAVCVYQANTATAPTHSAFV
jgi:holo-[acyl-carrier protein] synthase